LGAWLARWLDGFLFYFLKLLYDNARKRILVVK